MDSADKPQLPHFPPQKQIIDASDYVIIEERWTRKGGERRIAGGSWEPIEPFGFVPFLVLDPEVNHWTIERFVSPAEAQLLKT